MVFRNALGMSALLLAACNTVSNDSRGTIVVDGRAYETRTRVVNNASGGFEQTSVYVNGVPRTCLPASPGDCEAVVRRNRDRFYFD